MKDFSIIITAAALFLVSLFIPFSARAKISLLNDAENSLTINYYGQENFEWQGVLKTNLEIITFNSDIPGRRRFFAGFQGALQSVATEHYFQKGMLRDINYQLMPYGILYDAINWRLKFFINHWSFHKVDMVQEKIPEINITGIQVRVLPNFINVKDFFLELRTTFIKDDVLNYRRPIALGFRLEWPSDKLNYIYVDQFAEIGVQSFYQGEIGFNFATQKKSGVEVFGGWTNGAANISSFSGATTDGLFFGMRMRW